MSAYPACGDMKQPLGTDWRDPQHWKGSGVIAEDAKYIRWGDERDLVLASVGATARTSGQLLQVNLPRPRLCKLDLHVEVETTAGAIALLDFFRVELQVGCGAAQRRIVRQYVGQPAPDVPLDDTWELVLSTLAGVVTADLSTVLGGTGALVRASLALSTVYDNE